MTRYAPAFDAVVAPDARVERLADGFTWAEGPAWVADGGYLLFTDVPENRLHRWSESEGLSVFLEPSGYAGSDTEALREAGANGLSVESAGTVLMADSSSRSIERLDLATKRLEEGKADLFAFGRPYIANPDLVARMRAGAPLAKPDESTMYGGGAEGYVDYPPMDATADQA